MNTADSKLSIVIDIGGTNTRVALADGVSVRCDSIRRFKNADYNGLESVLATYLAEFKVTPQAACCAIAGPVRNGQGTLTNLDWTVDRALLTRATGAELCSVINDLQAQGHAVEHLSGDQLDLVRPGQSYDGHAARLVIGVGTGFNAAAVFRTEGMTVVPPAEAGHVDLPTPTPEMQALAEFLRANYGFAAVEDALSGRGLERIYSWVSSTKGAEVNKDAAAIMAACNDGTDPLASETVAVFCRVLGMVAGNLALTLLPFGGVFLVGGVARAVLPYLKAGEFQAAFEDKGRFGEFMQQFPVHSVSDDYAALIGMAGLLQEMRHGPAPRQ